MTYTPAEHKRLADECEAKAAAWRDVEFFAAKQRQDLTALGNAHYQAYLDSFTSPIPKGGPL